MRTTDQQAPASPRPRPRRAARVARALAVSVLLLLVAVVAAALFVTLRVRGSLPLMDGERSVAGLTGKVVVERDARGAATIEGSRRADVALATGYVHAQERFFQMDLLRRQAAGELAALLGPPLVQADAAMRRHRFRALAERAVAGATPLERALLDAYTRGVNSGLEALAAPPFEYLLLRARPEPWRAEDSLLVVYAMYVELQDENGRRETALGIMRDVMPGPLFSFLAPRGTEWDAPVRGGALDVADIPGPAVVDLRREAAAARAAPRRPDAPAPEEAETLAAGSNSWAVAGRHTVHGGAIVANDMHLPLGLPNIWYRARLRWEDEATGAGRGVSGVTLPGTPAVVVGSNGFVAWGFTNSYGDWSDVVVIERDPADEGRYLVPGGSDAFAVHWEAVDVARGESVSLDVAWTRFGPLVGTDHRGREIALRWVAHDPEAVNIGILGLEAAEDVDAALDAATRTGAPAQNFVVGDREGRIGWTILGPVPRRAPCADGRLPRDARSGDCRWDGYLAPDETPRLVDPPGGRLWTANARVVGGPALDALGDGGYALGARAAQIRDALSSADRIDEERMLSLQLDDRALFFERWRALLLEVTTPAWIADRPERAEFARHVREWGGRAAVDSVGFRLVRAFRLFAVDAALGPLFAACRERDERCDHRVLSQNEGPVWALLSERPPHLLGAEHAGWDGLLAAVADETLAYFTADGRRLADRTWGERNTFRARHPISRAVPWLSRFVDLDPVPLPGDAFMPRVQSPIFGASQRMVVSPGREESAVFHMPGGQSGHPLSPHYGDGHEDWVVGRRAPLLPGPARHVLVLRPPGA